MNSAIYDLKKLVIKGKGNVSDMGMVNFKKINNLARKIGIPPVDIFIYILVAHSILSP